MSTLYTVGQMNQLADALEAVGYTPDDITKMRSDTERLKQFKDVLKGQSEITKVKHIIDLDADPYLSDGDNDETGWEVEIHTQGGQFEWDLSRIKLFTSLGSVPGKSKYVNSYNLYKKVKEKPVFNLNMLDYLLECQKLIPDAWKGKAIFFWGTILRGKGDIHAVYYMTWTGERWEPTKLRLGDIFDEYNHVAVFAA